jgi:hypothetical protein
MLKNIIQISLFVVIFLLVYFIYESVMKPVRFNQSVDLRSKEVIQKLMDIRTSQMTFKSIHGKFTASFDTLIDFLRTGEIPVVKIIPDPTDTTFTKTIRDTLGYIPVKDSLFKTRPDFKIENIKYVPETSNKVFKMDAGVINKGGVKVNVFEASTLYSDFLLGLDKQSVTNLIASKEQIEKFPGIKVGSMTEASTDGNWE